MSDELGRIAYEASPIVFDNLTPGGYAVPWRELDDWLVDDDYVPTPVDQSSWIKSASAVRDEVFRQLIETAEHQNGAEISHPFPVPAGRMIANWLRTQMNEMMETS